MLDGNAHPARQHPYWHAGRRSVAGIDGAEQRARVLDGDFRGFALNHLLTLDFERQRRVEDDDVA
jgi:hypothetical protein